MNARGTLRRAVLAGAAATALLAPAASAAAPRRPDLTVSALSVRPAQVRAGGTVTVGATVRNRGAARAGASRVGLLLSADRRRDRRDVALGTPRRMRALAPSGSVRVTAKVTVPAGVRTGSWWLLACADAHGTVRESSERDNCARAVRLRVLGARVDDGDPTGPLTPPVVFPPTPPAPAPGGDPAPGPGGGDPGPGGGDPGPGGGDPGPGGGDPGPGGGDPGPGGGDPGPNDDPPAISIADAASPEDDGPLVFAVTLDRAATEPVTVDWATADGGAVAPGDYTGGAGTVTFAPGQTTASVTVAPVVDAVFERDEHLTVTLADPSGGTLATAQATGTIANDDDPPTLSIAGATVSESAGSAVLTVTLSGATDLPATVGWATAEGTATVPSDYAAGSGTLTFAPGETSKTVTVTIADDAAIEPDEQFAVTLTDAVDATVGTGTAAVTVNDDDRPAGLRLNELHPRMTAAGGHDRVELLALSAGTLDGSRLRFSQTPTADVTLPPLRVAAGDLVVVHFRSPAAIVAETTAKDQCPAATYADCTDTAWDLVGAAVNFSSTAEVVTLARPDGTLEDAVPFASVTPAPAVSFYQALQAIQAQGLWLPADCNGVPCTSTSFPTGLQVSVDWTAVPANSLGTTVARVSTTDTDTSGDWAVVPSSLGRPNP
jgi:hypothetical protein